MERTPASLLISTAALRREANSSKLGIKTEESRLVLIGTNDECQRAWDVLRPLGFRKYQGIRCITRAGTHRLDLSHEQPVELVKAKSGGVVYSEGP